MCEHCSTGTKWTGQFAGEEGICEYTPESEDGKETPDMCSNHPVAWSFERFVEDHLCQGHMEEENVNLDDGLGDFLRQADLQLSANFLPISDQPPPCSYIVFTDESGQNRRPCGNPAGYAKMVIERWSFCQEQLVD